MIASAPAPGTQPRRRHFPGGILLGVVQNAFQYQLARFTGNRHFKPFLTSLYINYSCNLKCQFCPYWATPDPGLPAEKIPELLRKIRPGHANLNITGGEPLLRPDIVDILKAAQEQKFENVVLNTNALLLHKKLEVLPLVDYCMISLCSLDEKKYDAIRQIPGSTRRIIENIKLAASLQETHGFTLMINSVITPDTIHDMYGVLDFCRDLNLWVSPAPEEVGNAPNPQLLLNPDYQRLLHDMAARKRKGERISVSARFLRLMAHAGTHECYPSIAPRVLPNGDVPYPCTPLGKIYGNIFNFPNLKTLLQQAYDTHGLPPCARGSSNCVLACYTEPLESVVHPIRAVWEHRKLLTDNPRN